MKFILKNRIVVLLFLSLLLVGCMSEPISSTLMHEGNNHTASSFTETKLNPGEKNNNIIEEVINVVSEFEYVEKSVEYNKDYCCKHCSKGKACGDSCISRSYTCHKAPGCACDY